MLKHQQLHHALVLREFGNFHRAAESANISQPAFSRSIGNLEASLGVTLFDRTPAGVIPTSHGRAMLERAEIIVAEVNELIHETDLSKEPGHGELSVAMGMFASEISGSEAIAEMAADYPKLNIHVMERGWQNVTELVTNRTVELGFVNTETVAKTGPLKIEPVARHEPVFFCRHDHPLLSQEKVTEKDLGRFPVAAVKIPKRPKRRFPGMIRQDAKDIFVRPSIEVENLAVARSVVAKSNAFSFAAPSQIEDQLNSGIFKVLPYSAAKHELRYGFVILRDRTISPPAKEFMDRVRKIEDGLAVQNLNLLNRHSPLRT